MEKCRKRNEQKGEEETASLMDILFYSLVIPKAVYLVRACACVRACVAVPGTASLLARTVLTLPCTPLPLWARLQLQHVAALC